jgi:hypothetical protein
MGRCHDRGIPIHNEEQSMGVPRSKNKDGVSYRWLFKIKHAANGSIEKYKAIFVTHGFSQKDKLAFPRRKALTMKRHSLLWPDTLQSEPS